VQVPPTDDDALPQKDHKPLDLGLQFRGSAGAVLFAAAGPSLLVVIGIGSVGGGE
jgi:hypothetical protein